MPVKQRIMQLIEQKIERVLEIRRDIHMHPEMGFDVERTAGIAAEEMQKSGLEVKTKIGRTGVVADLNVAGAKRRIALRADMDALPIEEMTDSSFKSTVPGVSHMCGHDSHTAMLIGAAQILSDLRARLKVNVRFIFQPNEENLPGGAPAMIRDGALEGVDEIFGLHVWPDVPTGKIAICDGPALGQPDVFEIEVRGVGGHAAMPNLLIDPVVIGAQFVNALQSVVSRNVDPLMSAVISVTQFHAGTTHNVIPQSVQIGGTVRTFDKVIQRMIRTKLRNMIAAITSMHGAGYTFDYTEGYPVTYNHQESVKKACNVATALLGAENLAFPAKPTLGGEDFAYYAQKIPGCFIFLGTRSDTEECIYSLHDPRFKLDESCMPLGIATHVLLALNESV